MSNIEVGGSRYLEWKQALRFRRNLETSPVFPCLRILNGKLDGYAKDVTAKVLDLRSPGVSPGVLEKAKRAVLNECMVLITLRGYRGVPALVAALDLHTDDSGNTVPIGPNTSMDFSSRCADTSPEQTEIAVASTTIPAFIILVCDCYTPRCGLGCLGSKVKLSDFLAATLHVNELSALRILQGVLEILASVHELDIVVLNLTMQSLLVDPASLEVLLTDFSMAKKLKPRELLEWDEEGDIGYMAPEMLKRSLYAGKPCDVWAAGVILYRILYIVPPFQDTSVAQLRCKIQRGNFAMAGTPLVSKATRNLLKELMNPNLSRRLPVNKALQMVNKYMEQGLPFNNPEEDAASISICVEEETLKETPAPAADYSNVENKGSVPVDQFASGPSCYYEKHNCCWDCTYGFVACVLIAVGVWTLIRLFCWLVFGA